MVNVRRAEVAARIHDAKEHGDLSENAEYEDAKNEQAFVEGRIQTLEALIKNATIIDEHHSTEHVQIGSTVVVESGDGTETFTIVGSAEAAPARGPDLERIARRPGAARPQEGRQGRGPGARPATSPTLITEITLSPVAARELRPWIGRTNWRPRSADRRSSTTARRRPGPVHVGSLRGPVILDAITRALRARGTATTLLYGVDDLDPMDAQALLTPDAVEHEMGRPLAHVPDQAGDCHASYARHHAQAFIDTFAGLGIRPDRYYWMSDLYAAGRSTRTSGSALDRAAGRARHLPPGGQGPAPRRLAPDPGRLRDVRQGRARRSSPGGTASGSTTSAGPTS